MSVPITRILLCLAMCLVLFSSWGCYTCRKHQDVARVDLYDLRKDNNIDSVAMTASNSNSIIGCRYYLFNSMDILVIGSKTHHVKFPINVRIQLFSQGNLQKELFFEVDKKMVSKVSYGAGCSAYSRNPPTFLTDDYCLYIENMGDFPGYDYDSMSCVESPIDSERSICEDS